ncbi:alpha-D-ribose 1-methylphosphonate 5-triphosphate diphosphatase [Gemmobacter aquatilis]|uniref:Alpha-D-ribose 1-methylphosphonate 5-triphosphate diphosphatase n=1 Tax=Gemmobacter aquatilis TaxID=933059 RepID=A0A1H8EB44_9RHOB|nr:alpha-D-ribose 1-methylphosphonate 5-triphosphate diphosphatase [Gemmobacter aquatilis]SEN16729.1 alpha-D-ribose 1-methylphosphonate 5-triphosphate diphosphatase [Gemmobacter aquatilis]
MSLPPLLPPLRLTGALVLRDGEMQARSVALADGRITRGPLPEVDLSGYLILPGIIDLHGDGFERQIAPRPSAPFPLNSALAATDREAAAHGVTTAYLAQGWSWEGGHRSPDAAEALMVALAAYRPRALTDLRLQLRAETHLVEAETRLIAAVETHRIGYVVFNDHLEEGYRMSRAAPADFALWARKLCTTPQELLNRIEAARARTRAVPRHLCRLAEAFDARGVSYGSHDDPNGETREFYTMIGARIAEFPLGRAAAAAAHAMMNPVVMGAPNVVRGGSQSGNIAATTLIEQGLCDALVSDYHIPALPMAAFALVDRGLRDLPQAWAMISTAPAEILRLTDRGRIAPGLRADLAVVNAETRVIEATICGGRLSYLAGAAARRFLAQPETHRPGALRLAAE